MVPKDDSHLSIEFESFFIIKPTILFQTPIDYTTTADGQRGKPVEIGFEYNSQTNTQWLTKEQIITMSEPF